MRGEAGAELLPRLVQPPVRVHRIGVLLQHPYRGKWHAEVDGALKGLPLESLPQRSYALAMDGVWAELGRAWGYHASTCAHVRGTLEFFGRHRRPRGRGAPAV